MIRTIIHYDTNPIDAIWYEPNHPLLRTQSMQYDTNPIIHYDTNPIIHYDTNPIDAIWYEPNGDYDTNPMHQQQVEKGLRLFSACCRLEAKLAQYRLHYDTNPIPSGIILGEESQPLWWVLSLWYEPNLNGSGIRWSLWCEPNPIRAHPRRRVSCHPMSVVALIRTQSQR